MAEAAGALGSNVGVGGVTGVAPGAAAIVQTGHGGHTGADAVTGGALRIVSAVIGGVLEGVVCDGPEGAPHLPFSHTRSPLQSVSF